MSIFEVTKACTKVLAVLVERNLLIIDHDAQVEE